MATETTHHTSREHHEHEHIEITIDGQHYRTPGDDMTGAKLKALAGVPRNYQLFLEVPGPSPDRGIRDDEAVELKSGMKFYTVVPGTLG
jgi:Multiubiquitin